MFVSRSTMLRVGANVTLSFNCSLPFQDVNNTYLYAFLCCYIWGQQETAHAKQRCTLGESIEKPTTDVLSGRNSSILSLKASACSVRQTNVQSSAGRRATGTVPRDEASRGVVAGRGERPQLDRATGGSGSKPASWNEVSIVTIGQIALNKKTKIRLLIKIWLVKPRRK